MEFIQKGAREKLRSIGLKFLGGGGGGGRKLMSIWLNFITELWYIVARVI